MSTFNKRIAASADDRGFYKATNTWTQWAANNANLWFGYVALTQRCNGFGLRFTGVTIPKGSTIVSAVILFKSSFGYYGTTVYAYITGERSVSGPDFVDADQVYGSTAFISYQNRRGTVIGGANNDYIFASDQVDWNNVRYWNDNEQDSYTTTPDISHIIQHIIDQDAWDGTSGYPSGGGVIVLHVDDYDNRSTATSGAVRRSDSYDGDADNCAYLQITYTTAPTVETLPATFVVDTGATLEGNISGIGSSTPDYVGFVWKTGTVGGDPGNSDPDGGAGDYGSGWKSTVGSYGVGAFDHAITGLTENTLYRFRACAHNEWGWKYGEEVTLTTENFIKTLLYDIDYDQSTVRGQTQYIVAQDVTYLGFVFGTTSLDNPGDVAPGNTDYDSSWVSETGVCEAGTDAGTVIDTVNGVWVSADVGRTIILNPDIGAIAAIAEEPTAAGTGYSVGDILTLTSGSGTATVEVLTVDGVGAVEAVHVNPTVAGTGYSASDVLTITTGDNNATVTVLTVDEVGSVETIHVNPTAAGTGYSANDVLTITTGDGNATVTVLTVDGVGAVETIHVNPTAAGSGYSADDVLTITTGDNNATVTVLTVDTGGEVLTLATTPVAGGTGYNTGTGQATSGGGGSGCTINVTAVDGDRGVLTLATTPVAAGTGYDTGTGQTTSGGDGTGCTVNITAVDETGGVLTLDTTPVAAGTGYDTGTGQATSGGDGTGCTVNITTVDGDRGVLTLDTVPVAAGSGYSIGTGKVTSGGDGTGCTISITEITPDSTTIATVVSATEITTDDDIFNVDDEWTMEGDWENSGFRTEFGGLSLDTTYFYRAAAKIDGVWMYGEEETFYTLNPVYTFAATDIDLYIATLNGETWSMPVEFDLDYVGFVWDTEPIEHPGNTDPTSWTPTGDGDGWKSAEGNWTQQPFDHDLTGLDGDTLFYFRAAVRCDGIWFYGEQLTFETLGPVITNAVTDIDEVSAELNGETTEITVGSTVDYAGFSCVEAGEDISNTLALMENLVFSGTDYCTVVADSSLNCGNSVSIEVWVKPASISTRMTIYSHGSGAAGGIELELNGYWHTGDISVILPAQWVCTTLSNQFAAGEWVHIAYTRSVGTQHHIYVNGVEKASTGLNVTYTDQTAGTLIGKRSTAAPQYFQGSMAELRIWDHCRTQAQILESMDKRLVGNESGLVAYWKMNEFTGSTLADSSSNSNTATIVGDPTWNVKYDTDYIWLQGPGDYVDEAFAHVFTGLIPGTDYDARAVARVDGAWRWANIEGFSTLASTDIQTNMPSNITDISARIRGETLIGSELKTVDYYAFVWDVESHSFPGTTAPGSTDYLYSEISDSGDYAYPDGTIGLTIRDLVPGTKYYYRAAAKVDGVWDYGVELNFRAVTLIGNPYQGINWDTYVSHKAQLHLHTNNSDGTLYPYQAVAEYKSAGFDILSITDHNKTTAWPIAEWATSTLYVVNSVVSYSYGDYKCLIEHTSGTFATDLAAGKWEIQMVHFPGCEQSTVKGHTPAWFADNLEDWGSDAPAYNISIGAYWEHAHPSYHRNPWEYYIESFEDYSLVDGLIGLEVYNKLTTAPSGADEDLWDNLISYFVDTRNIWGLSVDDMHSWADGRAGDCGYIQVLLSPTTFTEAGVKQALREGKFYWCYQIIDNTSAMPVFNSITIVGTTLVVDASDYTIIDWIDANGVVQSMGIAEEGHDVFDFDTESENYEDFIRIRLRNGTLAYAGTQPITKQYLSDVLNPPEIDSVEATGISGIKATLNGYVVSGYAVYYGFVWDTTSHESAPIVSPEDVENPYSNGWESDVQDPALSDQAFSYQATSLVVGETYYFRAVVGSLAGVWIYGDELSFVAETTSNAIVFGCNF